jgi:hypothetical protein
MKGCWGLWVFFLISKWQYICGVYTVVCNCLIPDQNGNPCGEHPHWERYCLCTFQSPDMGVVPCLYFLNKWLNLVQVIGFHVLYICTIPVHERGDWIFDGLKSHKKARQNMSAVHVVWSRRTVLVLCGRFQPSWKKKGKRSLQPEEGSFPRTTRRLFYRDWIKDPSNSWLVWYWQPSNVEVWTSTGDSQPAPKPSCRLAWKSRYTQNLRRGAMLD